MFHWRKVWALLLIALLIAACQSASSPQGSQVTVPTTADKVPRITPTEVRSLLDAGTRLVIVDTRSRDEWEQAHIPNALSFPAEEIEARHRELPRDTKIVLYCT